MGVRAKPLNRAVQYEIERLLAVVPDCGVQPRAESLRRSRKSRLGATPKSIAEESRQRFDADMDRFSNLENGQSATVDALLAMPTATAPHARRVLNVRC